MSMHMLASMIPYQQGIPSCIASICVSLLLSFLSLDILNLQFRCSFIHDMFRNSHTPHTIAIVDGIVHAHEASLIELVDLCAGESSLLRQTGTYGSIALHQFTATL